MKPFLIVFEFHQFSGHSSSTKRYEIIKWLKHTTTGADFHCVFWSIEQIFFHTAWLLFMVLSWNITCSLVIHGYILLCSLFNSLCFQYVLRNKGLTFWEISIGLNFTSSTRNDEKSDFGIENGGSTYTQVCLIHK